MAMIKNNNNLTLLTQLEYYFPGYYTPPPSALFSFASWDGRIFLFHVCPCCSRCCCCSCYCCWRSYPEWTWLPRDPFHPSRSRGRGSGDSPSVNYPTFFRTYQFHWHTSRIQGHINGLIYSIIYHQNHTVVLTASFTSRLIWKSKAGGGPIQLGGWIGELVYSAHSGPRAYTIPENS